MDLRDHENEEKLESGSEDGEEVGGDDGVGVVADEGRPGWRAARSPSRAVVGHVLPHGSCGDTDSKLDPELVSDALLPPSRIFAGGASDEVANLDRQLASSGAGFPPPVKSNGGSLPAEERLGLHDDESGLPVEEAGKKRHGEPGGVVGPVGLSFPFLIEGELLAKKEVFGGEGGPGAEVRKGEASDVGEGEDEEVHEREVPSVAEAS
jgi:hypothetical protein